MHRYFMGRVVFIVAVRNPTMPLGLVRSLTLTQERFA